MTQSVKSIFLLLCGVAAFTGCRLVDEDLRACDTDYSMDYDLKLETNITTEINTALNLETDVNVANALKTDLDKVFTPTAHDVDLSFYAVEGDGGRLFHENHIMDADQTSYVLYIPVRKYMHLAVANLVDNTTVTLSDDQLCSTASLRQVVRDTVPSHRTGIYAARLPMDILEGVDQQFQVNLTMANCAATVVLDTLGSHLRDIKVYASGFATGFMLADSTYCYDYTPVVEAQEVKVADAHQMCFTVVTFPSRRPLVKADEDDVLWEFRIYSTLSDGTVTETRLGVKEPLEAGHLRVITATVYGNGSMLPGDETVAVMITLDWKPGMEHEVIL